MAAPALATSGGAHGTKRQQGATAIAALTLPKGLRRSACLIHTAAHMLPRSMAQVSGTLAHAIAQDTDSNTTGVQFCENSARGAAFRRHHSFKFFVKKTGTFGLCPHSHWHRWLTGPSIIESFLLLRSLPGRAWMQSWGASPPSLSSFVSGRFATIFFAAISAHFLFGRRAFFLGSVLVSAAWCR